MNAIDTALPYSLNTPCLDAWGDLLSGPITAGSVAWYGDYMGILRGPKSKEHPSTVEAKKLEHDKERGRTRIHHATSLLQVCFANLFGALSL